MFKRRILINPVSFEGIGVHSGKKVYVNIYQEEKDDFSFFNIKNGCDLSLKLNFVVNENSTNLIKDKCKFKTIEHYLASVYFLGFSSLKFEVDSEEFPILDGSAKEIVNKLLKNSKMVEKPREIFRVKEEGEIREGEAYIKYSPSDTFFIDYTIVYDHPLIGEMNFSAVIDEDLFIKEIAPSRTFGFLKDAEYLKSKGLALGASLDNTVVLDDKKVLNPPLRFKDEMVRHKILDFIGDISFLKKQVLGKFKVFKGGHSLHIKLVRELMIEG